MAHGDRVLALLGEDGLRIALLSSLDHAALVRLANATGATVKGMRNQTLPSDRLARSVVTRAVKDGSARAGVLRALARSNREFLADYRSWPPDGVRSRLADLLSRPGPDGGRLLFALAREPRDGLADHEIQAAAAVLADALGGDDAVPRTVAKKAARVTSARAEARALRRENAELARRLGSLENQLSRSEERLERAKKNLAETRLDLRNLQLSQKRSEADQARAEREIRRLSGLVEARTGRRERDRLLDMLGTLKEAAGRQERSAAALEKLLRAESAQLQRNLVKARDALAADVGHQTKATRERYDQLAAALVQVRKEVASLREEAQEHSPARRGPAPGSPERVSVYVDVQNIYYGARDKDSRLDFPALAARASRGRRLVRAVAYVVESKEIDQSAFINLLQSHSFEVKRKALRVRADGSMKGNWDLEIALDVLADAPRLDVVVLVTGDGDFSSLVHELRRLGLKVEVYSFPANTAKDLRDAADRFVPITRKMLLALPPSRSGGSGRGRRQPPPKDR